MKTARSLCGFIGVLYLTNSVQSVKYADHGLKEVFTWKTVEFDYDSETQKEEDIRNGRYNPEMVTIMDSTYYAGTYFVSTPLSGAPATLSTISGKRDRNNSPLLRPFPDWSWYKPYNCDGIIDVHTLKIDKFGRFWVIDTGVVNLLRKKTRICLPKLLIFDLNNNNVLIKKFVFPEALVESNTAPVHTELQINDHHGHDTIAYLSDIFGNRLYVYDLKKDSMHVVEHPYFKIDPDYGLMTINGIQLTSHFGLYPTTFDTRKGIVYFHSVTSGKEYYVNATLLRKPTLTEAERRQFYQLPYEKKSPAVAELITPHGKLIFSSLLNNAIYAWDTDTLYVPENMELLIRDDIRLQFVTNMKLIDDDLMVTSIRFQNMLATGRHEKGAVNFRILRGNLHKLLKGDIIR